MELTNVNPNSAFVDKNFQNNYYYLLLYSVQ